MYLFVNVWSSYSERVKMLVQYLKKVGEMYYHYSEEDSLDSF